MNDRSSADARTATPEIDRSLREFQEHFDELVSHLDEILWMADADADEILYVSPAFEHVYGHPVRDVVEASGLWRDAVLPADRPALDRLFEVLRSGEKDRFESEYRIRRADGEVRRLSTRGSVVRDEDGRADRIVGITRDITERWTTEHHYELLFEAIPDLVGRTDGEGRYLYANAPLVEALGATTPDEVVGRTHRELGMREDLAAKWDEALETAFEDGVPAEVTVEFPFRGELRSFSAVVVPERGLGGQVESVLGVARDVTERRRAIAEVRDREARMLRAQEVAEVGDWSWDIAEDRVTVSRKLYDLWGVDPDEGTMAYERVLEGVHPEDRGRIREVVQRALDEGRFETFEHRIVRPDGTVRWMESRGEVERGEDGEVVELKGTSQDVTDRVEAHREVERERDLRAALFEENVDPIMAFEFDREGEAVVRSVNPRFEEMFGFAGDVLEGRAVRELLVPEAGRAEHEEFVRSLSQGEPVVAEVWRLTDEGPRLFRVQAIPIEFEAGSVGGYAWYTDLTAFRELEEEEAFKARLLDAVGQAVNATDAEGTITYWNEHAETLFGYRKEQALGRNIYELMDAPEAHVEEILDHMRRGETWHGELRVERRDGSEFLAVFTKEPLLDDASNLVGVIGISYDVTELRELEREDSLKAQLLDQVGQAVIATDAEGCVTYWNDHATEMYGWTAEEALGAGIMDLTVPDTEAGRARAEEIMAALARGETWQGEFTVRRKDGSTFPAWVSDAPVTDDDGNLVGVIGVSYDLAGDKEMQRRLVRTTNQLRARNRELQELSQATAHEFQSPIRDIVRYLQLLDEDAKERLSEEDRQHLGFAVDGARRIHDLVSAIQEYLDAATRPADPGPCDAGQVLRDVLAEMELAGDPAKAEVTWDDDLPLVGIGERSMKPILKHLLENALAYRGEGPARVHVGFERQGEVWVLGVRDEGIGIDPRHHERIFRPFRTLHPPHEGGGPGLGLSLCRGIVEAHGGTMWVRSEEGEGATFHATLPPVGSVLPLPPSDPEREGPGEAEVDPGDADLATPDLWED